MGVIRQLKKQIQPSKMVVVATNATFNGCRVLLAHPDPMVSKQIAKVFPAAIKRATDRASVPNLHDLYQKHFEVLEKIKNEEQIDDRRPNGHER